MRSPFFSILRLESSFPRPIGDSANPQTHVFDVRVSVINDANVDRVIYGGSSGGQGLVDSFVLAAQAQITQGAIVVGTSCGFLFEHQAKIQSQISVPFISSSLTLMATGLSEPIAVLSFDADILENAVWFKKACAEIGKIVVGDVPKTGHLYTVIRTNQSNLNLRVAANEVVQSALDLVQKSIKEFGLAPRTLLLECTNLGVYRTAIQKALDDCRYQCDLIDYNDAMARCWNTLPK
jgi:hypothetical protein